MISFAEQQMLVSMALTHEPSLLLCFSCGFLLGVFEVLGQT